VTTPVNQSPPDVVTFGETMAALRAQGALRLGGNLGLSVAGAESNVAIGLARLGHRVRWAGRVGADELGALVLRTLRASTGPDGRCGRGPGRFRRVGPRACWSGATPRAAVST